MSLAITSHLQQTIDVHLHTICKKQSGTDVTVLGALVEKAAGFTAFLTDRSSINTCRAELPCCCSVLAFPSV